ncbi:MAG: hypothetical protein K2Y01_11355 [Rhabdochlamydiaceae bacterium]|nr:hypothetical protein [Rhabdochlamydiaceae bacterium]
MNSAVNYDLIPSAPPMVPEDGSEDRSRGILDEHSFVCERVKVIKDESLAISGDIFRLREMEVELALVVSSYLSKEWGENSTGKVGEVFSNYIAPTQKAIKDAIERFNPNTPISLTIARDKVQYAIGQLAEKTTEEKKNTIAICRSVMGLFSQEDWVNQVVDIAAVEEVMDQESREVQERAYINSLDLKDVQVPLIGEKKALAIPVAGYTHGRDVKGGGGCYYRAIMINILEQVLDPANPNKSEDCLRMAKILENLEEGVSSFSFPAMSSEGILNKLLIDRLKQAAEGVIWTTAEEFLQDVLKDELQIDEALVRGARHLVANHLMDVAGEFLDTNTGLLYPNNGLGYLDADGVPLLQVATLIGCSNPQEMHRYCCEKILNMESYAEGVPVNLSCLARIFNFSLATISDHSHLRSGEGVEVVVQLVGDHYKILYPKPLEVIPPVNTSSAGGKMFFYSFVALLMALWMANSMKSMLKNGKG